MFCTKKRTLYTKVPKKKFSFFSVSFVVLFSFLSFKATAQNAAQNIDINLDAIQEEIRKLENLSNTCRFVQSIIELVASEEEDFSESITPELREEDKNKLIALRQKRGKECLKPIKKPIEKFMPRKDFWCSLSDDPYLDETPEEKRTREGCDNRKRCLESYWEEAHNRKPIAARIEEYKKIAAKEELFQAIYTEEYYKELFPDTIRDIEKNCQWIDRTGSASFGGAKGRFQRDRAACRKAEEALKSKIRSIEDKDFYEKNLKAWEEELQEKLKKGNLYSLRSLEKSVRYCTDEGNKGFYKRNCKVFAHKPSVEDKEHAALIKRCKDNAGAVASTHAFNSCMSQGSNPAETKKRINAIIAANKEYFKKLAEEADIIQSPEKASLVAVASPKPQKRDPASKAKAKAKSQSKLIAQGESSTAAPTPPVLVIVPVPTPVPVPVPTPATPATQATQATQAPPTPPVDSTVVTVSAPKEELCSKEYKETLRVQERFQDFLDNCIAKEELSTSCSTEGEKLLKEKLKEILSSKEIDEEYIDPLINTMLEEAKKEKGWSLSRSLAKMESESGFKQGAQNPTDGGSTGLMQVYATVNTEGYLRGLIDSNNIEYPDSTSSLNNQLLKDPVFNYKVAAALNRSSRIKSAAGREAEYLVGCTKIAATCKAIREETDAKKVLTLLSPLKGYRRNIGWREEGKHAGSSAALAYAMKMEHLTKKHQATLPRCDDTGSTNLSTAATPSPSKEESPPTSKSPSSDETAATPSPSEKESASEEIDYSTLSKEKLIDIATKEDKNAEAQYYLADRYKNEGNYKDAYFWASLSLENGGYRDPQDNPKLIALVNAGHLTLPDDYKNISERLASEIKERQIKVTENKNDESKIIEFIKYNLYKVSNVRTGSARTLEKNAQLELAKLYLKHKAEDNALLSEAITLYKKSEKSDPDFEYGLSEALQNKNRHTEAETWLKSAARKESIPAISKMANNYWQEKKKKEAIMLEYLAILKSGRDTTNRTDKLNALKEKIGRTENYNARTKICNGLASTLDNELSDFKSMFSENRKNIIKNICLNQ